MGKKNFSEKRPSASGRGVVAQKQAVSSGPSAPGRKIYWEILQGPARNLKGKLLFFIAGAVCIIAFLLFANTLAHDYALDDDLVYKLNSSVQKGIAGIPEIFRTTNMYGFNGQNHGAYRPVTQSIFAMEYEFFGLNPAMQHLVSVILFSICCLLLFFMLKRMLGQQPLWITLAVTLLFVAHPVHTEVVANIKSRDEIISFVFGVALTFIFLFRYIDTKKILWLLLSLLCFLAGLLSKEHIITMVPLIPLTLYFFTDKKIRNIAFTSAWFLIPAAIFLALRLIFIEASDNKIVFLDNFVLHITDGWEKAGTIMYILLYYIRLCIFPFPLSCDYSWAQTPQVSLFSLWPMVSVIVYAALIAAAIIVLRKKSIYSWCIIFFLFAISVYSHTYVGLAATMGERFLFTPSLPFLIAAVMLLYHLAQKLPSPSGRRNLFMLPLLVFFIVFAVKTVARNTVWKNSDTLFMNDVVNAPNSARMNKSAGDVLVNLGKDEKDAILKKKTLNDALVYLRKAYSIYADYPDNLLDLGTAFFYLGEFDSSYYYWGRFAELQPESSRVKENMQYMASGYYGRGQELSKEGKMQEAVAAYDKSLSYDTLFHPSWFNRGLVLASLKQYDASRASIERAVTLDSANAEYRYNLGGLLFTIGDFNAAAQAWNKTLELQPGHPEALKGLQALNKQ